MIKDFNSIMRTSQRGSTLLEVVVTIGVVALLVTGLVAATTNSVGKTRGSRVRSQAIAYAQQGIELARKDRDTASAGFFTKSGLYCLGDDKLFTAAATCTPNVSSNFYTRTAQFAWQAAQSVMKVTVTVSWQEGSQVQSANLVTYFSQWK